MKKEIYRQLNALTGGLASFFRGSGYLRIKCPPYADLRMFDQTWIRGERNGWHRIAMTHITVRNDELMADPDMEIRINMEKEEAEAVTYRDDYSDVYESAKDGNSYDEREIREMNIFLLSWLGRLRRRGYFRAKRIDRRGDVCYK